MEVSGALTRRGLQLGLGWGVGKVTPCHPQTSISFLRSGPAAWSITDSYFALKALASYRLSCVFDEGTGNNIRFKAQGSF